MTQLFCQLNFSLMNLEKELNLFEGYELVDVDTTFHKTNITTVNGALSQYQTIFIALCTVTYGLVSDW